ncbi:hypothetical protein ACSQ67_014913 [Phaseolus vulgaris]
MSQSCNQRPEEHKSSTANLLPSYLQILPLYIWSSLPLQYSDSKHRFSSSPEKLGIKFEVEKKWQPVYSQLGVQRFDHGRGVPNKFGSRGHDFT